MSSLDIGLAFELRSEFATPEGAPVDALEEYDSRETIDALSATLSALGHRPRLLGGGRAFLQAALQAPPQLVFNNAEGRESRSREAQVPAVCEMLGLPCTHSDAATMMLALDKSLAKREIHAAGLCTAPFRVLDESTDVARVDLPFPLFVKPLSEGSSMGVRASSRVADHAALVRETERCWRAYRQPVLVERYLPGPEITVAVRGRDNGARVLGTMEISPSDGGTGTFVYGLESKRNYRQLVRYHAPPRTLTQPQRLDAEQTALAAYRALDCRDIGRVDLRLDADGRANFMEINPLPGLNPVTGDIVVLAGLLGVAYPALIQIILDEALSRYPALR